MNITLFVEKVLGKMQIRLPHIVGGAFVYGLGIYGGLIYTRSKQKPLTGEELERFLKENHCKDCKFEEIAEDYDDKISMSELTGGIMAARKRLLKDLQGRVLEVNCGTGRNLKYYPEQVSSLKLVDISPKMVQVTHKKVEKLGKTKYCETMVADSCKLPFPDNHFDAVVDTFGLCSVDDPEKALEEMKRVCKAQGKIRLLEHGKTKSTGFVGNFINNYLDARAHFHARDWGCWWNRDIDRLVSNLKGVKTEATDQQMFGTNHEIKLEKE